jgi:NAD(P)-dependent dehydrogenase (short-subunit alcohol dehydrogenase family)
MRLDGRTIIVTGASSGIGRAVAERCLAEGANLVATGRRPDALAEVGRDSPRVERVALDLTDDGAPERLVQVARDRFGGVSGLVHAAGTVKRNEDIRRTSDTDLRAFIEDNLTMSIRVARCVYAELADGGGGAIVLTGSQLAHIAVPGYATYCATKGGIVTLVRALAIDGGPLGIRVNAVSPGIVRTAMAYVDRPNFDELEPGLAAHLPLRRIGEPEDIAGPAAFLLSDDAAWMTGQTIIVDGGFTVQ